jgi:CDP-glucose 4,6-dehydratase
MATIDPSFWRGRSVLLTGHTGFKGAWCAYWLASMGARVTGFALAPETTPNLFDLARIAEKIDSRIGDIRDRSQVANVVAACDPEIVLHFAAQPFVRRSVREPVETFATNVLGTAHLLDALREAPSLAAILVVTTDKVYKNPETREAFRESARLGGNDPYAASKAAAELVTHSFATTYFEAREVPMATARGGNVIGGGDFAEERLVPDIVRAVMKQEALVLRHPEATRPWQHVLDCLAGYLIYAQSLAANPQLPRALNFGPEDTGGFSVQALSEALLAAFDSPAGWTLAADPGPREATYLALDSALARKTLGWRDRYTGDALLEATVEWYRGFARGQDAERMTLAQIEAYMARCES